jgi:uncharacterized phage protein gp47/JayE
MSEYGITETGYVPKTIDVLETDAEELLVQQFGSNVDLSQQSPLWRLEQASLIEIALLWLNSEQIFYNLFVETAEGISLDFIGNGYGLNRHAAVAAEVSLDIYKSGSSAVVVPQYSQFQTSEGVVFSTDAEILIPAGDPASTFGTVLASAVVPGVSGIVAAGTITTPVYTISGIESSDNPAPSYGGEDAETDTEYRSRLRDYTSAVWTRNAIRSAALAVDGVASVKIIEGTTDYTCLVAAQTSYTQELEDAVSAAIGDETAITVEYTVEEAEQVAIDVTADVVLTSLYDESAAETDAQLEISSYIATLDIDDDVILAKIMHAIMSLSGIQNAYNLVLSGRVLSERHTYSTGTLIYTLDYPDGSSVIGVKGTFGGSEHTFVEGVDYVFNTSPAEIEWLGADLPDDATEFFTSYYIPPNAIGDIEINEVNVATAGNVDFTEV